MTPDLPAPAPASAAIDLRDSEVARIQTVDHRLVVALPVVAVRGRGGRFLTAVTLQLDEAEVLQRDDGCIGRLADGELRVDGIALPICLVPSAHDGRIELRLHFANGAAFAASGCALRLQVADGAGMVEHLHC
jgi:hypothetical protein